MIASLWIFLGLLAVVFAGGAILGGGAVYLRMSRREYADEPAHWVYTRPVRPDIADERPPGVVMIPRLTAGLPERPPEFAAVAAAIPRPVEWESPTEQFARLERQLVELAPALSVSIARSEAAIDELLASGALARPDWIGAAR